MLCSVSLRLCTFFLIIIIAACSLPENPISCARPGNLDCKITNSYGMFPDRSTSCEVFKVEYPETEEALKAIISFNTALKTKMKVATQYSHSIPKLVCPYGKRGVLISTKKLNRILNVDTKLLTMTVESGVTLRRLIKVAARNGMALPYTPYWWGLTIGGILGTGAHGSTLSSNGSSVHDHVKELMIISPGRATDNDVRVSILGENNEELKAAKTSLGVLGVIYKVTLKLEPLFKGYPVIGYHNHLQASGTCLDAQGTAGCAWDHRLGGRLFFQTAFSIKLSVVASFIKDVRKLVRLDSKALCSVDLNNGILMRYVTKSSSYLGQQEDAISFDFTYYRRISSSPRLYEDVIEEIEQMAFFKYNALPHWGKNRNVAFIRAIKQYERGEDFLRVKRLFDEYGLFSSEWTNQVLGLEDALTINEEGCALEGLCICNLDIHCAPHNGYLCREGKFYKEAGVCRYVPQDY